MGKRKVVEGKDKDTRKIHRQGLGKLRDLVIKPATKARYDRGMKHFLEFLRWNKLTFLSTYEDVDRFGLTGH